MRIYGKLLHCPETNDIFFDSINLFNKKTEETVQLDFSEVDYGVGYTKNFRLKDESVIGEPPKGFDFGNNRETYKFLKNCMIDSMCISGKGFNKKEPKLKNVLVEVGEYRLFMKVDTLLLSED